jgi:very-short-patch-repair endonuclease
MPKFKVSDAKREQAQRLRSTSTHVEEKLWRLLRSRRLAGAKFRRQVPLGPWIADFVSFEHKLIVEADGSQHADSERDRVRDADLKARGFRVLRFWNNDILQTPNGVLEAIWSALQETPSPGGLRPPPSPTGGEG